MSESAIGWLLAGWLWARHGNADQERLPDRTGASIGRAASVPASPDADLIIRLRAGAESALAEVMDRYAGDVLAIAMHYVRTPDIANDVTQDVFIRLWERRHTLDEHGNLIGYIRRMARNQALQVLRRDAAHARLEQAITHEYQVSRVFVVNAGMGALDAQDFERRVRSALATLSPRVREVALLHYERGLESGEIAELLEVAPQTIYNQLRTATKALVLAFREDGMDPASTSAP